MKCVFIVNKTQTTKHSLTVLHVNGYINMKEHDSVTVITRVVMTIILSVNPQQLKLGIHWGWVTLLERRKRFRLERKIK